MGLPTPIPSDVIRIILDKLQGNKSALKNTALVSSAFLEPSQAHLFARITLTAIYTMPEVKEQPIERLLSALHSNSNLASLIRELNLTTQDEWMDETKMPRKKHLSDFIVVPILKTISQLHSLTLCFELRPQTTSFKSAILDLCHLKSLHRIHLFYCPAFPVIHLSCLPQLRVLSISERELGGFTDEELESLHRGVEASHGALEALELGGFDDHHSTPQILYRALTHPSSQLNVSRLRVLKLKSTKRNSTDKAWKIMQSSADTLEVFAWNIINERYGEYYDRTPIDIALLPRLRSLSLSFITDNPAKECKTNTSWVIDSLLCISGRNILEYLLIMAQWDLTIPRPEDVLETFLRHLDSLFVEGGFPHLSQVKVFIRDCVDTEEQYTAAFESLPYLKAAGVLSVEIYSPRNFPKDWDIDVLMGRLEWKM